ncbi:MAG: hypothetical protein NVS3B7_09460 [Candidatus Elarobacter sp.]
MKHFGRVLADESGVTLVEYALVSGTFAVLAIGGLAAIVTQCGLRLGVTSTKLTALGTSS